MRHAPSTFHFSQAFRAPRPAGAIEWEELPSLAGSLAQRLVVRGSSGPFAVAAALQAATSAAPTGGAPAWDSTRPATLDAPMASESFREPLAGIAVREVLEPDVFRHFFGS